MEHEKLARILEKIYEDFILKSALNLRMKPHLTRNFNLTSGRKYDFIAPERRDIATTEPSRQNKENYLIQMADTNMYHSYANQTRIWHPYRTSIPNSSCVSHVSLSPGLFFFETLT